MQTVIYVFAVAEFCLSVPAIRTEIYIYIYSWSLTHRLLISDPDLLVSKVELYSPLRLVSLSLRSDPLVSLAV